MSRSIVFYLQLLITIFLLTSCGNKKIKPEELGRFVNDPSNGLLKEKKINDITIRIKYLPSSLLAYKEYKDSDFNDPNQYDSLYTLYQPGLTFVMEIIPDKNKDLMLDKIHSEQEFKDRVQFMNFELKDYIELQVGNDVVSPSIVNLENIYGLKNGRKVMIVFPFSPSKTKEEKIQFTFTDEIYATGINHFTFSLKDLTSVPELEL